MIPPMQGSSLFQDSSLNRTPTENCCISGSKGPNPISQAFPDRARNLISVVKFLDPEDTPVIRDSPYNFDPMNSPKTCHLGKKIISPNW